MTMAAIPIAYAMSKIKLKPLLIAGSITLSIFSFFIANYEMLGLLIGFSILSGISFSFFRVAGGPFYMNNSTTAERTHLFSFSFGMMLLAGMVGSLFSGKIVMIIAGQTGDLILGYRYTLYLGIISSLLAFIPFSMVKAGKAEVNENRIVLNREQLKKRGLFYLKILSWDLGPD
jgi:MFS family permease